MMKILLINIHIKKLLILSAFALTGCQSTKDQHCQEADWFELGRRVSSLGQPNVYNHKPLPLVCQQSENSYFIRLYNNGYNQGLVEFCRPEVAFEMGRSGLTFNKICPKENHSLLIKAHEKGQKFLKLDNANTKLLKRIENMSLEKENTQLNSKKRSQLIELEELKTSYEIQMKDLEESFKL